MRLTPRQLRRFGEDGYLTVPGVVPPVMVRAVRQLINHRIGQDGIDPDRLTSFRSLSYTPEIQQTREVTDLFNDSPVYPLLESMMGVGAVRRVGSGQIALRFPVPPGQDAGPPRGHLDGIGSGANGTAVGAYNRHFTALAVIYLADVLEPDSGNFTVWPGSHRRFERYFQEVGHQVLGKGQPEIDLPHGPVQITGRAGDLCIAHHQIFHTAAPNASPDIRYAAIFRVCHVDLSTVGNDAYTDIWAEWPGVRDAMSESSTA